MHNYANFSLIVETEADAYKQ